MTAFVRVLVGLVALFFVVFGLRFVLTPEAMAGGDFAILPVGVPGLATVRGDLGGAFLAVGIFAILGLVNRARTWLYAAAIVVGTIAACRIVGFALDGLNRVTLTPFVVEVVMVAILLTGARRLSSI
jgi:uncharacterized protein DUF4345